MCLWQNEKRRLEGLVAAAQQRGLKLTFPLVAGETKVTIPSFKKAEHGRFAFRLSNPSTGEQVICKAPSADIRRTCIKNCKAHIHSADDIYDLANMYMTAQELKAPAMQHTLNGTKHNTIMQGQWMMPHLDRLSSSTRASVTADAM